MHLDHLTLCASYVPALTTTVERHFDHQVIQATRPDVAGVTGAGDDFAFLMGSDGSCIVVSQIAVPPDDRSSYPPQFHFGLMQKSDEAVHAKHAQLAAAGFD